VYEVVIGNAALVYPGWTVTFWEAGTCTNCGLLLERLTTAPPAGAGPVRNTFPCVENPPAIVDGVIVKELRNTDPPEGETVTTPLATEPL
jgi:hypothetical protein